MLPLTPRGVVIANLQLYHAVSQETVRDRTIVTIEL